MFTETQIQMLCTELAEVTKTGYSLWQLKKNNLDI
jgi:hypothetical protein